MPNFTKCTKTKLRNQLRILCIMSTMDLREAFDTIPDIQPDWRDRYLTFLSESAEPTSVFDKHHILPRALFPEFENFRRNPWNRIDLNPADHVLAHYYLYRAAPKNKAARLAFFLMVGRAYSSLMEIAPDEDLVREIAREYEAVRRSGGFATISGWVMVYRGLDEARAIPEDQVQTYLEGGWTRTAPKRQWVCRGDEEYKVLLRDVPSYEDKSFSVGRAMRHNKETREKMSQSQLVEGERRRTTPGSVNYSRGDNHHARIYGVPDAVKAKIARTLTGKQQSADTIAKRARSMTGKKWNWTEDSRKRKSEAMQGAGNNRYGQVSGMRGKTHSAETKAKMSEVHKKRAETVPGPWKGKVGPMKGKTHSGETKARLAAAQTGKKLSEEVRAKMREGHARRKALLMNQGSV